MPPIFTEKYPITRSSRNQTFIDVNHTLFSFDRSELTPFLQNIQLLLETLQHPSGLHVSDCAVTELENGESTGRGAMQEKCHGHSQILSSFWSEYTVTKPFPLQGIHHEKPWRNTCSDLIFIHLFKCSSQGEHQHYCLKTQVCCNCMVQIQMFP